MEVVETIGLYPELRLVMLIFRKKREKLGVSHILSRITLGLEDINGLIESFNLTII